MKQSIISKVMAEFGRKGGQARAERMTAEERSAAASRAGRAPRPGARRKTAPEDASATS